MICRARRSRLGAAVATKPDTCEQTVVHPIIDWGYDNIYILSCPDSAVQGIAGLDSHYNVIWRPDDPVAWQGNRVAS